MNAGRSSTRGPTMRATATMAIILLAWVPLSAGSYAQEKLPLKPRVGVPPSFHGFSVPPDSLQRFYALPFRPDPQARLNNLSTDAYAAARDAADVDPGILIFPDTSVGAEIPHLLPPGTLDPQMIIPEMTPEPLRPRR